MRRIVVAEYTALGAAIDYDGLGSVLATLPGNTAGPRVMVTAHMDEVGLMVQYITADGFIRVKTLGGVLEQALPDQRWTILGRNGPGGCGHRVAHDARAAGGAAHQCLVARGHVPRRRRVLS